MVQKALKADTTVELTYRISSCGRTTFTWHNRESISRRVEPVQTQGKRTKLSIQVCIRSEFSHLSSRPSDCLFTVRIACIYFVFQTQSEEDNSYF
jgi:hypothetical protein